MKPLDFKNRKVLITGASGGIGQALTKEFARRGAQLILTGHPKEKDSLETLSQQLVSGFDIKTWIFPVDLLAEGGPELLYQQVKNEVGSIFALVNNAGTVAYGKFWEREWPDQLKTLQLNFNIPAHLMHLFLPDMLEQKEGAIFNTSSVSALQPTPFQSIYGATKAGLQSLSQAVRAELLSSGITVCTLNPPYIDTELLKRDGYPEDLRFYAISGKRTPEWLAKKALKAFEKRKMMYVPGFWPCCIHLAMVRISPRWLVDAVSHFFMQGKKKKSSH